MNFLTPGSMQRFTMHRLALPTSGNGGRGGVMRGRWWKFAFWTAALAVLSVPPALAGAGTQSAIPAGSLVFVKSGRVYVARTNGSLARAVTPGGNGWAWPSETDSGIIAVAGGRPRIVNSFDPSGSDE